MADQDDKQLGDESLKKAERVADSSGSSSQTGGFSVGSGSSSGSSNGGGDGSGSGTGAVTGSGGGSNVGSMGLSGDNGGGGTGSGGSSGGGSKVGSMGFPGDSGGGGTSAGSNSGSVLGTGFGSLSGKGGSIGGGSQNFSSTGSANNASPDNVGQSRSLNSRAPFVGNSRSKAGERKVLENGKFPRNNNQNKYRGAERNDNQGRGRKQHSEEKINVATNQNVAPKNSGIQLSDNKSNSVKSVQGQGQSSQGKGDQSQIVKRQPKVSKSLVGGSSQQQSTQYVSNGSKPVQQTSGQGQNSSGNTSGAGSILQGTQQKKKRRRRRNRHKTTDNSVLSVVNSDVSVLNKESLAVEKNNNENSLTQNSQEFENKTPEVKESENLISDVNGHEDNIVNKQVVDKDTELPVFKDLNEKSGDQVLGQNNEGESVKKKRRRRRKKKSTVNNGFNSNDDGTKSLAIDSNIVNVNRDSQSINENKDEEKNKPIDESLSKEVIDKDSDKVDFELENDVHSEMEHVDNPVLNNDQIDELVLNEDYADQNDSTFGNQNDSVSGDLSFDDSGIGENVVKQKSEEKDETIDFEPTINDDYSGNITSENDGLSQVSTGFVSTGFNVNPMAKAMAENYENEFKDNKEKVSDEHVEKTDSENDYGDQSGNENSDFDKIDDSIFDYNDKSKDLTFDSSTETETDLLSGDDDFGNEEFSDEDKLSKDASIQPNKFDDLSISDEDLDFEMNTNINSNVQNSDDVNEVVDSKKVNAPSVPTYDVSSIHEEEEEIPFVEKPIVEKSVVNEQSSSINASTVDNGTSEVNIQQNSVESVSQNVVESVSDVKEESKKPEMPKIEEPKVDNFSEAIKSGLSAVFKRVATGVFDSLKSFFKGSGRAILFFPSLVWGWLSKFKIKYLIYIVVVLGVGIGIYFVIMSGFFSTLSSQIGNLFKSKPKEVAVIVKNTDMDLFNGYGLQSAIVFGGNDGSVNDRFSTEVNMAFFFGRLLEPKIAGETGITAALFYGKLGEMSEQLNLYVTYVKNLEKLQSLYSVNVYELLDRGTKRDKDLYDYLQKLKDSRDENNEVLRTINLNIDDLKNSFNSLNNDRTKYETDFFSAMDNLEAEKSDALLKTFIDIVQKQAALKARVGALTKLQTYYTTALAKLDKRITAVEQNEGALIKGVHVVDVPGGGVDVIIKPQATQ